VFRALFRFRDAVVIETVTVGEVLAENCPDPVYAAVILSVPTGRAAVFSDATPLFSLTVPRLVVPL
jgi:hypothetical protein